MVVEIDVSTLPVRGSSKGIHSPTIMAMAVWDTSSSMNGPITVMSAMNDAARFPGNFHSTITASIYADLKQLTGAEAGRTERVYTIGYEHDSDSYQTHPCNASPKIPRLA